MAPDDSSLSVSRTNWCPLLWFGFSFPSWWLMGDFEWGGVGQTNVLHFLSFSNSDVDCTFFSNIISCITIFTIVYYIFVVCGKEKNIRILLSRAMGRFGSCLLCGFESTQMRAEYMIQRHSCEMLLFMLASNLEWIFHRVVFLRLLGWGSVTRQRKLFINSESHRFLSQSVENNLRWSCAQFLYASLDRNLEQAVPVWYIPQVLQRSSEIILLQSLFAASLAWKSCFHHFEILLSSFLRPVD